MRISRALFVTLFLSSMAACDDGASGGTGPGAISGDGPAYAITTQVFGASSSDTASYILLTDTLDSEAPLSLDNGVEVPGRALGVGPEGGGAVFVAGDAAPTVTRYDLQEDGSLRAGATISFQGKGIATLGEYQGQFQFVSETKAYFFDGATAQVVIWNPKDMTVTGDIPLDGLVLADATLTFSAAPLRRGSDVITFAGWRNGPEVPSRAAVIIVNSETDEATLVTDERCGYVRDGVQGPDGKIYLATEAYGAAVHRLNPANAAAPCMLRFDPATSQFDADFHVELSTLFGGGTAGALIRGPGDEPYLRVLDEAAFEILPDTHPRVLASAPAWRWARVALGDAPTATVLDAEPSNGSVVPAFLGDRSFVLLYQGQESTSFLELGGDGPAGSTLSTPGLAFSALKLR